MGSQPTGDLVCKSPYFHSGVPPLTLAITGEGYVDRSFRDGAGELWLEEHDRKGYG